MNLLYGIAVATTVFLALLAIVTEDAIDDWKMRRDSRKRDVKESK